MTKSTNVLRKMTRLPIFSLEIILVAVFLIIGSSWQIDSDKPSLPDPDPEPAPSTVSTPITQSTKCERHEITLVQGTVKIAYGLRREIEEEQEARLQNFPNARSFAEGGCKRRKKTETQVWYCPQCREVEKEWKRVHRHD